MAIFNVIFLKKSLFVAGTVGLSSAPITLIVQHGGIGTGVYVSDLKKNLKNISSKYSSIFGIEEFFKEVLYSYNAKSLVEEVFSKDIAFNLVKSSKHLLNLVNKLTVEERTTHDLSYSLHSGNIQQFYDDKGGSRNRMIRKNLSEVFFNTLKKYYLDFDHSNFVLNKSGSQLFTKKPNFFISKEDLENHENWSKISFVPKFSKEYQQDPEFFQKQFKFINFAYKQWFQEVKPFFVWMSLWKYHINATNSEIFEVFDQTKIGSKQIKPSYNWPVFQSKSQSGLSTVDRFKKFFKNIVSSYNSNQKIFVPKGYTEDKSTVLYVEGLNMYTDLYTKFASGANYLYDKQLEKQTNSYINSVNKLTDVSTYSQLIELFKTNSEPSDQNRSLKNKGDLFKQNQQNNYLYDLVSVKDTPWIFVRNQAGVHAIATDYQFSDNNKDPFNYFNYRLLQFIYRKELDLENVLDISTTNNDPEPIHKFKQYLNENFSRLLLQFFYNENNLTKEDSSISSFKSVYELYQKQHQLQTKYKSRMKLRETLLSAYYKPTWKTSDNSFESPDLDDGIQGLLPFKINENPTESTDFHVFQELEKIYDRNFFDNTNTSSNTDSLTKSAENLQKELQTKIQEYLKNLNLRVNSHIPHYSTDRIFSNNFLVDWLIDLFLDHPESINQVIFNFYLKKDYIRNSVLGIKKIINEEDNLFFKSPSSSESSEDNFLNDLNDDTKYKQLFKNFDDVIKSYYYSKFLLEGLENNPWSIFKYSGKISKEYSSNFSDSFSKDLKNLSHQVFKEKFLLNIDNFRSDYYQFLNSLVYLSANNFEKFRELFSKKINYSSDAFLLYENIDNETPSKITISDKSFKHPYLFHNALKNSNTSVQSVQKWLIHKLHKDAEDKSKDKVNSNSLLLGLYLDDPLASNPFNLPESIVSKLKAKSLFRYGKDPIEMNNYILSLQQKQFEEVVSHIKNVVSSSDWVSSLESDHVYVKESDKKELKILNLTERKNLLSAVLNNVKVEISDESIEKSKFKNIFLTDPNSNYSFDGSKHSKKSSSDSSFEEKIKESDYFKVKQEIKKQETDSSPQYTLLQINSKMFETFDAFKTWVNTNMSSSLFWNWIISSALTPEVKHLAQTDLINKSEKIDIYDIKWKNKVNIGYQK